MDEFLVLLQAKLDEAKSKGNVNADIKELQNQLDKLKVQVELDPKAGQKLADDIGKLINQKITISNIAVNQSNLSKTGQQIGQIISDSAEKTIGDVTSKVIGKGFTVSPAMSKKVQSELESIVKDWTNNKGKVNSITIDTKTDFNEKTLENIEQLRSATVQYSNELGQVITKTLKYKQIGANTFANGETEVIKGWVESASTYKATLESTSKSTNTFVAQQKKTVTDLTNQVNQIYKSAIDQNASKPIKDSTNLSNLENKYNDIVTAIGKMGNASEATFTDERNSVNTLISDLKIVVKEYKNAETAATSMRSKDVGTIKSIKTNELNEFIAKIKNSKVPMKEMQSEIAKLKTSLSGIHDTDSLTAYLNQFDIANSKFKSLKEQFAKNGSLSSVIFNPVDLEKQGKVYIQRVRNTIEAIKPELESKLRSAGYSDIEIKGVEDAKGKIKSLTATVTDATGAFKQLNFERAKIQGSNKINHGFIQTDDVKVIGNISSEIDKTQNSLSTLKVKWEEQGVLVGEFKAKIDQLESSLSSVGSKDELNGLKSQIQELKNEASTISQIHEIQLSMDNGHGASAYQNQIQGLINDFVKYGDTIEQATERTKSLQKILNNMNGMSGHELVSQAEKFEKEFRAIKVSVEEAKLSYDRFMQPVSKEKASSLINRINEFLTKNTKITKGARTQLEGYIQELNKGVNLKTWNDINNKLKETQNSMRGLKKLGASLKDQFSQAAQSFTQWLSVSSAIMLLVSKGRNAVNELKNINSILTEISKTADQLSKLDLSNIGNDAFDKASKYGKSASDYLTGIQEMYRAGYSNAENLAELSTLAQAAGDMEATLANDYLIATDAAYKLKGNTEALNAVLDGQNYITNRNALSMKDLAEATKIAASQSASSGISIEQSTAAMGTMIATTRQGGNVAARAWKGILMNIQQVEGEVEDGEIIDAEALSKYEKACEALGVSLKEVKDGMISLRDPMQILKELSEAYTSLDESDARRANLISAVGGKYRGNQLNALLENWSLYEKMLKDYAEGSGSAMEEAMKSANNWEGSMNRLDNTFTKVVNNIIKSDVVIAGANLFNGLLSGIDKVTSKFKSLGTIGLGAGLFAGVKNTGKCRMSVRIS